MYRGTNSNGTEFAWAELAGGKLAGDLRTVASTERAHARFCPATAGVKPVKSTSIIDSADLHYVFAEHADH